MLLNLWPLPFCTQEFKKFQGLGAKHLCFPLGGAKSCSSRELCKVYLETEIQKPLVRAAALLVKCLHKLGHVFISSSTCTGSCIQKHELTGSLPCKFELVLWMTIFFKKWGFGYCQPGFWAEIQTHCAMWDALNQPKCLPWLWDGHRVCSSKEAKAKGCLNSTGHCWLGN